MKITREIFSTVTVVAILFLAGIVIALAWTNPSAAPPGGAGALTVDSTGRVGIGTATPGEKLVVTSPTAADTKIEVNAGGDQYAAIRIKNSQRSYVWQVTPSTGSPGGRLRLFDESAPAERLTVLADGNVGIGTAAPASKLDVIGDLNITGLIKPSGSAGVSGQALKRTSTGMNWQTITSGNVCGIVAASAIPGPTAVATCPSGSVVIGGGAACAADSAAEISCPAIGGSCSSSDPAPIAANQWLVECNAAFSNPTSYAICCPL